VGDFFAKTGGTAEVSAFVPLQGMKRFFYFFREEPNRKTGEGARKMEMKRWRSN
jgi:hypothetical protein